MKMMMMMMMMMLMLMLMLMLMMMTHTITTLDIGRWTGTINITASSLHIVLEPSENGMRHSFYLAPRTTYLEGSKCCQAAYAPSALTKPQVVGSRVSGTHRKVTLMFTGFIHIFSGQAGQAALRMGTAVATRMRKQQATQRLCKNARSPSNPTRHL